MTRFGGVGTGVVGVGRVAQFAADVLAHAFGREDLDAGSEGVEPGEQVDGKAVLVLAGGDGDDQVAVVGGVVDAQVAAVVRVHAVRDVVAEA